MKKLTVISVFEEVARGHMEIMQGADILLQLEREKTRWWRLCAWLGLEPYVPKDVQCSQCLRWRWAKRDIGYGKPLWLIANGEVLCPSCRRQGREGDADFHYRLTTI